MELVLRPPASPVSPLEKVAAEIEMEVERIVEENSFSLFPFR